MCRTDEKRATMQCFRPKVAPETDPESSTEKIVAKPEYEFGAKTAEEERCARLLEQRKEEKNELVRKLLIEQDMVKYLRRQNEELFARLDERARQEFVLQGKLKAAVQRNKGLEQAINQVKAETVALSKEMQEMQENLQTTPLELV